MVHADGHFNHSPFTSLIVIVRIRLRGGLLVQPWGRPDSMGHTTVGPRPATRASRLPFECDLTSIVASVML